MAYVIKLSTLVRRRPWARGMNSAAMKYYEELVRTHWAIWSQV